jgi:hypothetical protein
LTLTGKPGLYLAKENVHTGRQLAPIHRFPAGEWYSTVCIFIHPCKNQVQLVGGHPDQKSRSNSTTARQNHFMSGAAPQRKNEQLFQQTDELQFTISKMTCQKFVIYICTSSYVLEEQAEKNKFSELFDLTVNV